MKDPLPQLRNLIAVTLVMAAAHLAPAQSIWNAVVGTAADTNWSTAANWSPGGVPSGDVIFNDATGVANGTAVNSVVDALFGNTISSLTYTNVATYQNALIADGVTLNLSGNLTGGSTSTDYGTARTNNASLLGTNGTLWINNNTAVLYLGLGGTASTERSILDLSRLGTFNATLSQIQLGTAVGSIVRAAGTLYLARTNTITGTYSGTYTSSGTTRNNVTIDIGDQNGNAGAASYLYLGLTNAIFADTIVAGKQKPAGYILFNPAFTYANSGASAYFRGQDGVGPVAVWNLGDGQGNTGSGVPPTGVADFTGGTVDALVTTMYLGRASSGGTATSTATGTLIFGPGLFNVGTLYVGAQPVNNLRNGVGTLTVNSGGTLLVSSALTLGFTSSAGGAATTVGTLNIRGGTVQANSISTGAGSGANAITISGGTLVITNPVASSLTGVTNFMATNATLQVSALNGLPTAVVTSLVLGGPTNTVIVKSIPNVAAYPAQFTVIKYATLGGVAFNVGLGTPLPPSTGNPYRGYISNNVANKSVDLVITDGPTPANTLTWAGTVADNNWNFGAGSDLNWLIGATSTNFNQGDFVTFDDAAADTTVNLAATLMPSGVNVTNNSKTYTFGGSGYLSGAATLVKQGTGTLILDDSANDFTGGVTVSAGTLQVGNNDSAGTLPPSSTVNNNGTLVFNQASDLTVSSAISGAGALIKNNTDTLTLSGANSFTGPVTVNEGILQAGINAALGATNDGTTVASGATLDVNGHNLGGEVVTVSGAGFGGLGAIVNQGASANPALSRVTLAGNTSLGGPGTQGYGGNLAGRWDIRLTSSGATDPAACSLSTGGNAYNLAKIGANYVALVNVTVDPALGDIDIQNGTLSFQYNTTSLGNPSKTLTVQPGASLDFYSATNLFNKQFVINGDPAGTINVLNNSAGTNTVIGPMTLSGNCIVNCANSTSLILSNAITGSGSLLKAGTGTGALVLGGACSYTGGTMVSQGALLVDGTLSDGATNAASTTLGGRGTVQGVVDVQGTLNPGSLTGAGTFTAAAGLLLESGATVVFDLSATNTASGGVNDLVRVTGDLNANGNSITLNLLQGTLQPGAYRLFNYSGALPNSTASFSSVATAGPATRYGLTLDYTTANQINLIVSGGPATLLWNSTASTTWDTSSSQNWSNQVTHVSPDYFYTGDSVLFSDLVAGVATSITLDGGAVIPAAITNNSTLNNFTISGAGKISGATSIVKLGGSTLTLSSSNDFSGPVLVLGGTLVVSNASALGLTNGATIATNNATLDLNGQNLGLEPIIVSGAGVGGNGAIVNNGAQQIHALRSVTLAGDTTFGGPGGNSPFVPPGPADGTNRWDIRAASTGVTNESGTFLSTGGQPYKLTKVGSNQVAFVSVAIDAALGDIDIRGGNLAFQLNTTGMGNPTNTVTIESTGLLSFYHDPFPFNKVFVLNGDGATIYNENNVNTVIGPMTLIGSNVFNIGGTALHLANNTVGGGGSLNKFGGSILYLEGTNTYTGDTVVNAGTLTLVGTSALTDSPHLTVAAGATLDASARADGTLTLAGTQLLAGNGTVNGSLTVGSAATVSPGLGGIGALTVTNVVSLQGTTAMELGSSTNDVIHGAVTINYGGTLSLSFTPGSLTAGNTNKLFSATTYSGSFANITPPTPGTGLLWNTNTLAVDGTLRIANSVNSIPVNMTAVVAGSQLQLSWPPDHLGWDLQTNSVDVANSNFWFTLPGSASSTQINITLDLIQTNVFYRMHYLKP